MADQGRTATYLSGWLRNGWGRFVGAVQKWDTGDVYLCGHSNHPTRRSAKACATQIAERWNATEGTPPGNAPDS